MFIHAKLHLLKIELFFAIKCSLKYKCGLKIQMCLFINFNILDTTAICIALATEVLYSTGEKCSWDSSVCHLGKYKR